MKIYSYYIGGVYIYILQPVPASDPRLEDLEHSSYSISAFIYCILINWIQASAAAAVKKRPESS